MEDRCPVEDLSGKHISYWLDTTPETSYPTLEENIEADVAIVGGGIAGLTTAYLLKNSGKTVAVVEAGKISAGVTGNTTAKITSQHRFIYSQLSRQFGNKIAQIYGESQQTALELIASLIQTEKINCDFKRAKAYIYTETKSNLEEIKEEAKIAQSLGLPAFFTSVLDLPYPVKGAVGFKNQAYFHPRKYLLHLAKLISGNGSYIFENSQVFDIDENSSINVQTQKGKIKAKDVVIATHYPILNKGGYFTRLVPLRSYALGVYVENKNPEGMYIDYSEPLFSVRPQLTQKGEMLIITGFEHKTGHEPNTMRCYKELYKLTQDRFNDPSISYYWSTQDNYTPDHIPFIGRYTPFSKHLFLATGFEGWGMTNGTLSGMILSDLILKRDNPWVDLYNPSRGTQLKEIANLAKQNIHVAQTFIKDRYLKNTKEGSENLKNGTGEVREVNGEKVAVYKDEEGTIHTVSAVCTHLGCIVNFNNAEKTWDCPCHGSRFDYKGNIVHSPAVKKLKTKK
ncbi:MAG: FAD-dependent oxidoreductase [Patescibacteria group bacterium]|jgi:glycine/D-amino acid oxidase-like deaminating enzyme/nitrite reductase/ring-hydroxylating ferredoxin subunit